jgi:uncharacterized protein (TIGR03083 family)
VKDVVSHLYGFETMLRGGPVPTREGEWPEYVKNPIGELNEAFVDEGRTLSGADVLARFVRASDNSLAALRQLSDDEWEKVGWSPEGERPYHRFQETRILDSWIHLQDIRDALLEPEDDHGPGEEVVVNRFEGVVPFVVGKRMNAPDGTIVQISLSGRLARTFFVVVTDGRASGTDHVDGPVTLAIHTPVALFWRRCAGRISGDAFLESDETTVDGNVGLARDFAHHLAVMI